MEGEGLGKKDLNELRNLTNNMPEHVKASYSEKSIPSKRNPDRVIVAINVVNTGKCTGCKADDFRHCQVGFVASVVNIMDRSY